MISLEKLGMRICIIGCSSSGKSTLADRLSSRLNIIAYHLDTFAHHAHSNWRRKSINELVAAHNNILKEDKWIIDGNYSVCMSERINKATSIIWLDMNPITSACRYLARSLEGNPDRPGRLPGAKGEFSLFMLRHILFSYPKNRAKYRDLLNNSDALIIPIKSMQSLNQYCRYWGFY